MRTAHPPVYWQPTPPPKKKSPKRGKDPLKEENIKHRRKETNKVDTLNLSWFSLFICY